MKDMPDLGKNMMAQNMLDWFTILAFYEASDRRLDGETLLTVKRRALEKLEFLGRIVDGNKSEWLYRLFEKTYVKFNRMQKAHQARGEWLDSWKVEINPEHRTEGFCFHLVGCPIARYAKAHGYDELLPYLCRTDHFLAEKRAERARKGRSISNRYRKSVPGTIVSGDADFMMER